MKLFRKSLAAAALVLTILSLSSAQAQMASQRDARNLAVLKAVIDIKINDAERFQDMQELRNDAKFYRKLSAMLEKLDNSRTKDSKNRQILRILENAGDDIYNILK